MKGPSPSSKALTPATIIFRFLTLLAFVLLATWTSHLLRDALNLEVMPENEQNVHRVIMLGSVAYIGLLALPFVPGAGRGRACNDDRVRRRHRSAGLRGDRGGDAAGWCATPHGRAGAASPLRRTRPDSKRARQCHDRRWRRYHDDGRVEQDLRPVADISGCRNRSFPSAAGHHVIGRLIWSALRHVEQPLRLKANSDFVPLNPHPFSGHPASQQRMASLRRFR